MSKKKIYILTIALILLIALSTLIFLGIGSHKNIQIVSFIFIILTEIIIYGNVLLLFSNKLNTFAKAGFSSTLILYIISIILINIIFNSLFSIKSILITNFSLLLIYLLVDTFILFFKE